MVTEEHRFTLIIGQGWSGWFLLSLKPLSVETIVKKYFWMVVGQGSGARLASARTVSAPATDSIAIVTTVRDLLESFVCELSFSVFYLIEWRSPARNMSITPATRASDHLNRLLKVIDVARSVDRSQRAPPAPNAKNIVSFGEKTYPAAAPTTVGTPTIRPATKV